MLHLRTVLWHNQAEANSDYCSLFQTSNGFQLQGVAVLKADDLPMRVNYQVDCNPDWKTQSVELMVWKGHHEVPLTLMVDEQQRWWHNGHELSDFRGLLDVDLGFTPATNTIPIRRMKLNEAQNALTTTVWIQFPSLKLMRFPQRYTRTAHDTYLFESLDDSFQAKLKVDEFGLVTDYETLWRQVAHTN
ncbi:MAG: putative glycolipid-binding domain-containing protein [Armatimonadetes bacterium]|nr:putative glycolipid-binding domain-containing protein [Anaerolineae bacterium]